MTAARMRNGGRSKPPTQAAISKRDPGDGQKFAEHHRTGNEKHDHAGGAQGFIQGLDKSLPGQLAPDNETARTPKAPTAAASVGVKKPKNRPPMTRTKTSSVSTIPDRDLNLLAPGKFFPGRALLRMTAALDVNGDDEKQGHDQGRDDPGHKQRTDGLLGQHPVDDQHHAGRHDHPQPAAGGHRAGGQFIGIVVALHFRKPHRGHGGGGGRAGPHTAPKAVQAVTVAMASPPAGAA